MPRLLELELFQDITEQTESCLWPSTTLQPQEAPVLPLPEPTRQLTGKVNSLFQAGELNAYLRLQMAAPWTTWTNLTGTKKPRGLARGLHDKSLSINLQLSLPEKSTCLHRVHSSTCLVPPVSTSSYVLIAVACSFSFLHKKTRTWTARVQYPFGKVYFNPGMSLRR